MTDGGVIEEEYLSVPKFAEWCRDNCRNPAQGFDDGRPCGREDRNDEGEPVFRFCGFHWAAVL